MDRAWCGSAARDVRKLGIQHVFQDAFSCGRASRCVLLPQAREGCSRGASGAGGVPQVVPQAIEVLFTQHLYQIGDARFLYLLL
jgi:hypothetical protein